MSDRVPTPTGEVHPVADLFPMLPDDELAELAQDILFHGLQQPIVLDDNGVLIDGRNRLAACRIAEVDPTFISLNGTDPVTYILSANGKRRHMSKGALVMASVKALSISLDTVIFSRLGTVEIANKLSLKNHSYASQALAVLGFAADLSDWVISGAMSLNDAYTEARERKAQAADQESQLAKATEQLTALRESAPDLAELVETEQMSLREAVAAWREREREHRERRTRDIQYFENATTVLWSLLRENPDTLADEWIDGLLKKMTVDGLNHLQTGDGLRQLATRIEALALAVDRRGGLG